MLACYKATLASEFTLILFICFRNDFLSLEELLVRTVHVRTLAKLRMLERELRMVVPGRCQLRNVPTLLSVPVLEPCMENEKLTICVDALKGNFLVSLDHESLYK